MPNRTEAPKISIPENLNILQFETIKTANNIDLHYINTGSQDVIRISVVFKAGVKYQSKIFQASSMIAMLAEGTTNFNSDSFAEKVDFYGIYFDQSIDRDYCVVTVCCLQRFLGITLELLKESLTCPTFPQKEFDIFRNKKKQTILIDREKVNVLAREEFIKSLFGEKHPYGTIGAVEDLDKLTTEDLKSFFNEYICAENCFAVVTGKFNDSDLKEVSTVLEQLKSNKVATFSPIEPISKKESSIIKENSLQTSIRIGKVLFNRNHEDFAAMQILSTVLGGYFSSRLVKNLREDKGYTYGVSSMMINHEDSGYFAITTEVAAEYAEDSIKQIFYEIERLQTELVTEEELEMVKNVMIGEVLRVLDGPFGINDVVIENIQNNTDNNYLLDMIQQVKTITNKDLQNLACKHLQIDSLSTIYVGKKL
ncbi:MAG: pitrilysin family protein [Rikenellaceae bacterium]